MDTDTTIAELEATLKERQAKLQRTKVAAIQTKLKIDSLKEDCDQQMKNQERLQTERAALIAKLDKTYAAELLQQIDSTKQKIASIQHDEKLISDVMSTIQIEPCNALLSYLKYISEALEQLRIIKTL